MQKNMIRTKSHGSSFLVNKHAINPKDVFSKAQ